MPSDVLWEKLTPFFKEENFKFPEDEKWKERSLTLFKSSMETLKDASSLFKPLSIDSLLVVSPEGQEVIGWPKSPSLLQAWQKFLKNSKEEFLSQEEFSKALKTLQKDLGLKGKELFMPLRVAILGTPHGAELKELVPLIPKNELIKRVESLL